MCDQLVLGRVCGTSWNSGELDLSRSQSVPSVDSKATMCDQFVLRRVFATSWFSVESVCTVGSQERLCDQLVSQSSLSDQMVPRRVSANN